jgi:hypothetical protein
MKSIETFRDDTVPNCRTLTVQFLSAHRRCSTWASFCLKIRESGMLRCASGVRELQPRKQSANMPEDLNLQQYCCQNLKDGPI